MPPSDSREFTHSDAGRPRKLEAVECGIVTFDQEFLAHIVAGNGMTIGEQVIPQLSATETPRLRLT